MRPEGHTIPAAAAHVDSQQSCCSSPPPAPRTACLSPLHHSPIVKHTEYVWPGKEHGSISCCCGVYRHKCPGAAQPPARSQPPLHSTLSATWPHPWTSPVPGIHSLHWKQGSSSPLGCASLRQGPAAAGAAVAAPGQQKVREPPCAMLQQHPQCWLTIPLQHAASM
jgi:hypothetical protein